jgi:hypothetical protein
VLLVFVTVAENCCVWFAYKAAVVGVMLTARVGSKVTVADADLVPSAWLVAVSVTVCCAVMPAGAAYRPLLLIDPVPAGLIDQVTAVLLVFVTLAENCWVWLPYKLALLGATVTPIGGINVTVAEADFVVSAWLVAVTVTVCCVAMAAGAV